MTTANWMAIVGIVLGSNLLVSVVQLLAGRFRFDRRADQMKSWQEESAIADALEKSAGIEPDEGTIASKIAFASAVRSNLNSRIMLEIVPRQLWSATATLVYSTLGLTLGIAMIEIDEAPTWAGVLAAFASLMLATCVGLASIGRGELRAVIINRLNGQSRVESIYYRKVGDQMRALPHVPKAERMRKRTKLTNWWMWAIRHNLPPDLRANVESFLENIETRTPIESSDADPKNAEHAKGESDKQ